MADLPLSSGRMPTTAVSSTESTVPPWLAARRARVTELPETPVAAVEIPAISPELAFAKLATPPVQPPPLVFTPNPPIVVPVAVAVTVAHRELPPEDNSLKGMMLRWIHSSAMAGVMASFLVHSVLLGSLAVVVFSTPALHRSLDIFGVMGDADVNEELDLDAVTPIEAGRDAAPIEFTDTAQIVDFATTFDPSDSIVGLAGGAGRGNGTGNGSGDGNAVAIPNVQIPGYAVTKGSFSAWTEPKDPVPDRSYEIVIQFQLPPNIKNYRGSDLTGMVIGTDGYKQPIRRNETFTVVDGSVQYRIFVPGAKRLVKDTIRVESKLLREKQLIEIEF